MSRRPHIFDLESRVPRPDRFDTLEKCRAYDRDIRTSMIIPIQHMMRILAPYCRPGASVLEVGAGSGLVSLRLAALFPRCSFFAVESNDAFLEIIRENLIFANLLSYGGELSCEWARPSRLPIDDGTVDVVFSFCAMNRWANPFKALAECKRVCRSDGLIVIFDLARDADDGMISFILQYAGSNHQEFMDALRASFTIDEMRAGLHERGLDDWIVQREGINLITSSQPLDVTLQVGDPGVYDDIFAPDWSGATRAT